MNLKNKISVLTFIVITLLSCSKPKKGFEASVESLQQYKTPAWFNEAKFGIWVCWNAYTVPAVGDWYARNMYIEGHPHYKYHLENYGHPSEFGYKDVIQEWKGENFNAQELVDLFVDMGAKYIVGMANHHDNFDLWDSKHHEWNSVNYGPKRDIIGEFQDAVSKHKGIRWGLTSHVERASCWFQTSKGSDKEGKYADVPYDGVHKENYGLYLPNDPTGDSKPTQPSNAPDYWKENWLARCKDLFDKYDPDFFYVDGGVPFPGDDSGQTGLDMISYLYNQNMKRHGGKNEAVMAIKDWYKKAPYGEWGYYWDGIATLNLERARLPQIRKKPWQTDTSIGDWTYVRGGTYRPAKEIIHELVDIVSKNGNMLLNVSPKSDGTLDKAAYQLLKEIGAWMRVNGESIYGTKPWRTSGVDDIRIVQKGHNTLYLTLLEKPKNNKLLVPYLAPRMGSSLDISSVSILGDEDQKIEWSSDENGFNVELPNGIENQHAVVLRIEGENLGNYDDAPIQKLYDRKEALTGWWQSIPEKETKESYKSVTTDYRNRIWAIKKDNSLIELKDGKEVALGIKALDVGASASGVVYVGIDNSVNFHPFHDLNWIEFPDRTTRNTHTSTDEKQWMKLPGIKAKRCDIGQTGTIWITDENNTVNYYLDLAWKPMDKKAEDIACGGGWVGAIAIISEGQLLRFEGTHWDNLGGNNLKTLDISIKDEIIVALDDQGQVSLFDKMGATKITSSDKKFIDVACGIHEDKDVVIVSK